MSDLKKFRNVSQILAKFSTKFYDFKITFMLLSPWGPLPGGRGAAAPPRFWRNLFQYIPPPQILAGLLDTLWNFIWKE